MGFGCYVCDCGIVQCGDKLRFKKTKAMLVVVIIVIRVVDCKWEHDSEDDPHVDECSKEVGNAADHSYCVCSLVCLTDVATSNMLTDLK